MVLDAITNEIGIEKILKKSFPKDYKEILSVAYYLAINSNTLSHIENFKAYENPSSKVLSNQRISELLQTLSTIKQKPFFNEWINKVLKEDYLCYNITSISSYPKLNEYVKYGYNRDKENLPQINLAVLYSQESKLPVYYNKLSGNITNVNTLHHFLKTFDHLNLPKIHLVMYKGFYSQNNIEELLSKKTNLL